MSVPTVHAHPTTTIEIKDSCDCSCGSSCWPRRKARHVKKPQSQERRVDEVAKPRLSVT